VAARERQRGEGGEDDADDEAEAGIAALDGAAEVEAAGGEDAPRGLGFHADSVRRRLRRRKRTASSASAPSRPQPPWPPDSLSDSPGIGGGVAVPAASGAAPAPF